MLAEIAAANDAFSIIKSAVQNKGDLTKVAHKIAEYSGARQSIVRQAHEDRSAGKSGSDIGMTGLSSKHRPVFSGKRKKLNERLGPLSYTTTLA